ncbi:MAG: CTP synthase (glutamine hydrolyzing), partial [Lachnospiraceae bacterium]|nr:CTP synthase (glutamine hydrolyzing) [Lachnospiraceae bacterium]
EALRQFQAEVGRENAILIQVTLIPFIKASGEMKTKPTQMSVKTLQSMGLWPDILVCRSDYPIDDDIRGKIALFCNVKKEHVLQNLDAKSLYEVPLKMEEEKLAQAVCECLKIDCPEPDLDKWKQMVWDFEHPEKKVTIALVGKYVALHDAYLSVAEALKHGGIANKAEVEIKWIESEELETEGAADRLLNDVDGILVPGGFGSRGIEGKIAAIKYARENRIPFLGICLGMQLSIVEFARNILKLKDASGIEFNPDTTNPVIALMPEQEGIEDIGGTLRLGAYPCVLSENTKAYELYGKKEISERHRHRYEVNNDYRDALENEGMVLSGKSPDGRIVEMIELKDHPYFVGTQAHPEFKSRPDHPHPLFNGLIKAAINRQL